MIVKLPHESLLFHVVLATHKCLVSLADIINYFFLIFNQLLLILLLLANTQTLSCLCIRIF